MVLTFTGSKASGNLTSVGTLTLTDTGAAFTAADYDQGAGAQGGQRVAVLWNNAITTFKGVALIDSFTSTTVLKLLTEFLDPLTGDTVTQVVGGSADAYTISQNMADLVGGALSQNEFQFTTTDEIIWGAAADPDGITFYDENVTLLFDNALAGGAGMNNEFRGGYVQFGKVLDWVNFVTSQGCHIMVDDQATNSEIMTVTDAEAKLVVAGSVIHNHRHQGSRMGSGGGGTGGNGSEAEFQIYMNCSTNANVASGPSTGQVWDANAADQRLINLDYWGTGNTGTNGSGVGVRWGDGTIIGGSYGFSEENGSIGMFGSDANITHSIGPVASAVVTGLRLRVLNILQSGNKTVFYRTSGGSVVATVTLINIISDDRRAGFGASPGSNANNNVGLDFNYEEIFTGLVLNTRLVVERSVDNVVADSDVAGADGQALIRLLHEEITGHTSDNKFTDWDMGAWMYGFDPTTSDIVESTTPLLGGGTGEDVIFGGALVQATDVGITESTQATVAAYTDIDITDRLYDRAADWKMLTDANAQYPTVKTKLVAVEGNLAAVAVGTDIDIDSGAAAVFAVNTGTDLITIDCALAFDPGVTFAGIKADNIQFLSSSTIGDNLILTGIVTINAAMNLTGVTINGDLHIATGGNDTLEFSNVIVTGDILNDSAGNTLTINAINGTAITTTEPGATNGLVNIRNPVTIRVTGVTEGTSIKVIADRTAGTVTKGDVLLEGFADVNGELETTDFNYEAAFDVLFVTDTSDAEVPRSGDDLVTDIPGAVADGDLMVLWIIHTDDNPDTNTITPPAGWDEFRAKTRHQTVHAPDPCVIWIFTRVADNEPANYSWGFSVFGLKASVMTVWRNTKYVISEEALNQPGSVVTSIDSPSMTTTVPNDTGLFYGWNEDDGDPGCPPPGVDFQCRIRQSVSAGTEDGCVFYGYEEFPAAIVSGVRTWGTWSPAEESSGGTIRLSASGMPVVVRTRNQGIAVAAISKDSSVLVDQTTEANNVTADDVDLLPVAPLFDDGIHFGATEPFSRLKIDVTDVNGSGSTIVWRYWNGTNFGSLSGVVDGTNKWENAGENIVSWTVPSDWQQTTVNNQGPLYYILAQISTVGSANQTRARLVTLDSPRFLPFITNRNVFSTGLTVAASWVRDTISKFDPAD